ncbi:MAG: elongation factor P [Myxococcales bacterium]|nr:elongation factor P [Myxococcales bacterium]
MYDASDLRKGLKILIDGQPYIVVQSDFVKPGKGAAFTRTKMKNLLTGGVIERNIRSGEKVELADVEENEMTFLYKEAENFVFMDKKSYEQVSVTKDVVEDNWRFLKDNLDVQVTFYNGRAIAVTPPNFVSLKVTHSEPGVRGDTSSGATKPATLETGATINVPLFINVGESLRIDTRTGQYIERTRD